MDYIGLGMVLLGLVWSGSFGYAHVRAVGKAKASESWPSALGTVLSTEIKIEESSDREGHTTTWYNPVVIYSYSVGGKELQGKRLRFGNPRSANQKKAEAALVPYSAGATVPVRYNPEDPKEAVLETRKPGPLYLFMALAGLLFIGMGIFWQQLA